MRNCKDLLRYRMKQEGSAGRAVAAAGSIAPTPRAGVRQRRESLRTRFFLWHFVVDWRRPSTVNLNRLRCRYSGLRYGW